MMTDASALSATLSKRPNTQNDPRQKANKLDADSLSLHTLEHT